MNSRSIATPVVAVEVTRATVAVSEGSDIRFHPIQSVNGLSQTRAAPTIQDKLGFLWFGTQYGLNRFDGYRFKAFRHVPGDRTSLGGVYVRSLFIDHSGTLWVGCDESLDRYDARTETFTHFHISEPGRSENLGPAIHISEDHAGRLWLSTFKGLFRLDPNTGVIARFTHKRDDPSSLGADDINFTDVDQSGTFWVANGAGLDAFDPDTGKVTEHIPLSGHISFMFHEDRFGTFWLARTTPQCPLAVLDRTDRRLVCYTFKGSTAPVQAMAGIYSMIESRDGNMWMATEGGGLLKFDRAGKKFICYRNHAQDSESLGSDSVIYLYEDQESNIWVDLHDSAPYYFSERRPLFETFTHQREQLAGSLVTSMYKDRRGVLWIASTGALNRIDRVKGTNTVPPGVGTKGEILSIIEDRAGVLVAGSFRPGLQQLDPATGEARPYHPPRRGNSNQGENPIMRLFIDHAGTLWAATWGGLRRFDPQSGQFTTFKPATKSDVDYSDIKEDARGNLWLGGESGLQRFDPVSQQFKIYEHNPDDPYSVSDHRVTSVFFDHAGALWLGTQNGLDHFDTVAGRAKAYYEKDGLAGNVVSCILEDQLNTLWMGTNNGLSNFDPRTERFNNYSVADGLPGPDLTGWSTCSKGTDGEMFFGGYSGAIAFYPDRLTDRAFKPRTVLTDLQLAGMSVPIGGGSPLKESIVHAQSVTLTHRDNAFAITFAALSYFSPATNRYRYRLDGLDHQWHEVGSDQRIASYTTLPPGKYTFHVQGATSRGAWDEPGATLSIRILPPWWATWWFTASYITVLVLLLVIVYRFRQLQAARQFNIRLEERVEERTRLARELHDTLLQTIQSSKMVADHALDETRDFAGMRSVMQKLSAWLGQATQEGRAALDALRATDKANDLMEDLRQFASGLEADGSMQISFQVIGTTRTIHPLVRDEIYRIGCESIRNAVMHSQGSHVHVELRYAKDILLRVSDDGIGIPDEYAAGGRAGHFGLQGMRERAAKIGGTLSVTRSDAFGTQITLRTPDRSLSGLAKDSYSARALTK